jgi:hypothetical protein
MLARLRATHDQLAPKEFLIVQFFHCPSGFLHGLHLDKGKPFGPLIVPVADYLGVLNVPNAVKQLEQVTFCRIK